MVPLVLLKRNRIVAKLRKAGAVSPETALTLEAAGAARGDREYPGLVAMMLREKTIAQVDGRFYLCGGQ